MSDSAKSLNRFLACARIGAMAKPDKTKMRMFFGFAATWGRMLCIFNDARFSAASLLTEEGGLRFALTGRAPEAKSDR